MTDGMCPHCGTIITVRDGLTGDHDWPAFTRQVCPGSKQVPLDVPADK